MKVRKEENYISELVKVRGKSQITLPRSVREALRIEEGDLLEMRTSQGQIVMRVKKLVDGEQAWFWTERWQRGEREAEADSSHRRTRKFKNATEAIKFLHGGKKPNG